jgi:SAM-dependent methyltransferase
MWEYAHQVEVARQYDRSIADSGLARFDEQLLSERFQKPGRLADLGCGSGRLAVHFARQGCEVWAVDLSHEMLRVAVEQADAAGVPLLPVEANLCELDCLASASFDYVICMFSTLGMIEGEANRLRALEHMRRLLVPGGRLALHVHNVWFNAWLPAGRSWLVRDRLGKWLLCRPGGDRRMHDRGIPNMFMHVFSCGEICGLLREAGLVLDEVVPLDATCSGPLARPHWLPRLRANGWVFFAHRPT